MSRLNSVVRFSSASMGGLRESDAGIRMAGLREEDAGIRLAGIGFLPGVLNPAMARSKAAGLAIGTAVAAASGALAYANYASIGGARSTPLKVLLGIGGTLFALTGIQVALGTIMFATAPAPFDGTMVEKRGPVSVPPDYEAV